MRLIDADALRRERIPITDEAGYTARFTVVSEEAIQAAPTVDAEPVVHGRWIDAHYYETTAYGSNDYYTCSRCGNDTVCGDLYNYCPWCGSKMDEEATE